MDELDIWCDSIDAAVFSGDVLFDAMKRQTLKLMAQRWLKEIERHETIIGQEGKDAARI